VTKLGYSNFHSLKHILASPTCKQKITVFAPKLTSYSESCETPSGQETSTQLIAVPTMLNHAFLSHVFSVQWSWRCKN